MKKYTIYQITNILDKKIYIGKHQTCNLNDGYMGSGKLLKRAQHKYGLENFEKQILHIYDTEEEMNAKEAELVTEEFCCREDTYNICVGGKGGFSYINSNPEKFLTEKRLKSLRPDLGVVALRQKYENDLDFRKRQKEHCKSISPFVKGNSFRTGVKLTDETRQKMSRAKIGKGNMGNNSNAKKLVVDGIMYSCLKEAAVSIGCHPNTLSKRIKNNEINGYFVI